MWIRTKTPTLLRFVTVLGTVLDSRSFPATADGYRQLLTWARLFGVVRRAGVECTGSYGAALTRYLQAENVSVTEVNQPDKQARRRHGKSDSVDAQAAHAVLSGRATATAKAGHARRLRCSTNMASAPISRHVY
ncbi:hypothetical protein MBT84_46275 [Streptomyces sp. MBT84]|nr:hypothetical protein [Streptomyces sp. MBT84]